jgi:hypothetical protein
MRPQKAGDAVLHKKQAAEGVRRLHPRKVAASKAEKNTLRTDPLLGMQERIRRVHLGKKI